MNTGLIVHLTSAHQRYDIRIFVKECRTLAAHGLEVALIVADGKGDEIKDGVNIIDVGKPNGRKQRMLLTPKAIYNKVIALHPRLVHFHDPELMLISKKLVKLGYKVIYDVHEDLPKQVLSKPWLPKIMRPVIAQCAAWLERFCATKFAGVVVATPIIARRFNAYHNNVVTLCNYPLLSELANITVDWNHRYGSLCYIGSISKTRGIEPLVNSLKYSKVKLKLAGIFSDDVSLCSLSKLDGYEWVDYCGVLDRGEISGLLSTVKIGMVTLLPTPSYVESLPIKLFEYMLAGIPVVASNFELWHDIIIKHNCGVMVDPANSKEIAEACTMLLDNKELAQKMGENGKKAVIENYNWEVEQQKLISFYYDL